MHTGTQETRHCRGFFLNVWRHFPFWHMFWYLGWAGEWKSSAAAQERFRNEWAIDALSHLSRATIPHKLRTGWRSRRGSLRRRRKKNLSSEAWCFCPSYDTVGGGKDSPKRSLMIGLNVHPKPQPDKHSCGSLTFHTGSNSDWLAWE